MKLNLIAALLLCASVASAASETTTTTTTTTKSTEAAPAAPPVKAKKVVKKKTTKKVEEKADGAKVETTTTTTTTQVTPAAATSVAAAPAPAAPTKKWGVTLLNESVADYAGGKDLGNAQISTTNYVGASYKITSTEKVGLRQSTHTTTILNLKKISKLQILTSRSLSRLSLQKLKVS